MLERVHRRVPPEKDTLKRYLYKFSLDLWISCEFEGSSDDIMKSLLTPVDQTTASLKKKVKIQSFNLGHKVQGLMRGPIFKGPWKLYVLWCTAASKLSSKG